MRNDFLSEAELRAIGLARYGRRVLISRHALLFGADRISIGDDVRIDAFSIISATVADVVIGSFVHVSAYAAALGRGGVRIGDFVTISPRVSIFSSNDDLSGTTLAGPTVPDEVRGAHDAPVSVGDYAMIGTGSIVLPGVALGESSGVGALSLVREDVPPFVLVGGVPARQIGVRSDAHRELARRVRAATSGAADNG